MKLVVGLGNPGSQYRNTRHNLGFMVVDELAGPYDIDLSQEKFHAWFGLGTISGHKIVLAKPTTFVNRSGQAVLAIGRFYKLDLSDLLVITDDMALPIGKIRIRAGGSSGGHNGLQDISQRLGTEDFARLRVGIGSADFDAVDHVLGGFAKDEIPLIQEGVKRAADAARCWIEHDIVTAMNRFNPEQHHEEKRENEKEPS